MKQNIHFFIFLNIAILALLANFFGLITNIEYIYRLLTIFVIQFFTNFILLKKKKIQFETNFERKDFIFYSILLLIFIQKFFIPDNIYDTNNYHIYLQQEDVVSDISTNLLPAKVLNNFLFPLGDKMHYIFRYFLGFRLGTILSYYVIVVMFYQLKRIFNILFKDSEYNSYLALGVLVSFITYIFISSYYIDTLGTAFILEILCLLLENKNIFNNKKLLLYISFLTGLSMAIKLPNIFMIVPLILFSLFKHRKEFSLKLLPFYALCIILTIVPILPYCINNYIQTGSPLFPYYNNVLKSEYYSLTYFKDSRFGIPNIFYALIWPIYTSVIKLGYGDDWMIRDLIWALGYIVSVLSLFAYLVCKYIKKINIDKNIRDYSILALFLTIFWEVFLYGYMRYALIIPIVYYIVICVSTCELIKCNKAWINFILFISSTTIVILLYLCNYAILSVILAMFTLYPLIKTGLKDNSDKIMNFSFIFLLGISALYTITCAIYDLNTQKNILSIFVDRNTPTIEIDGVWGVIADDSSITELVRNSATPIYNLDKSNYTSERALELYKEKVINSDKDIYVLIDSKKSKYKLYALEKNGFEIAEIVDEYDVNTLHFLEASNIVQLIKVKYVGI